MTKVARLLLLTAASYYFGLLSIKQIGKKKRNKKRWLVRPVNTFVKKSGRFLHTFRIMKMQDPEEFYKYTRLYPEEFEFLVSLVRKRLTKRSNINTITVEERVAITLR